MKRARPQRCTRACTTRALIISVLALATLGTSCASPASREQPSSSTPDAPSPLRTVTPSPTEAPLKEALRIAEMPERPSGRLMDVNPGPATTPAMAPLYLVDSEIDRLYDESVRLARGRDPGAQLVSIDLILAVTPEAGELLFLSLVYFSPLDSAIFAYERYVSRSWRPASPLPLPVITSRDDLRLREKASFAGLRSSDELRRPGVLPWTRWRDADLARALFIVWDRAGRPETYAISGHERVLDPYEVLLFVEDRLPPNATGLARILTAGPDYYVCLGATSHPLPVGGRYCLTPGR